MNKPLVSIIIPIYKVEKYLNKCIDSVVNQTYKNIEVILVDDGSPDLCPQMCDAWSQKDGRIRVIHKSNGGLSDARNAGIQICTGEYICFVDSDDWVEPTMVQLLLEACLENNTLLAVCGRYDHFEGKDECEINKCPLKNEIVEAQTFTAHMLISDHCDCGPWGKLYHRSLWDTIQFPKGRIYEDIAIMYKVVLSTTYVATINKPLYNYLRRPNSIVTSKFSEKLFDYPFNTQSMLNDIEQNYPELYAFACWAHTKALIHVLDKIAKSDRITYIKYKAEIKSLQAELIGLKKIWMKSDLFGKKDRIYGRLFSNGFALRMIGLTKRILKKIK